MATLYEVFEREGSTMVRTGDAERVQKVHEWIATLSPEKRQEASRRASRSYSVPETCIRHDGCRLDGDDIVWPDGERYPTRREWLKKRTQYRLAELEMIQLFAYRDKLTIMADECGSDVIKTEVRINEIRIGETEAELANREAECKEAGIEVKQHPALAALW
jgi:hypothetical protein